MGRLALRLARLPLCPYLRLQAGAALRAGQPGDGTQPPAAGPGHGEQDAARSLGSPHGPVTGASPSDGVLAAHDARRMGTAGEQRCGVLAVSAGTPGTGFSRKYRASGPPACTVVP